MSNSGESLKCPNPALQASQSSCRTRLLAWQWSTASLLPLLSALSQIAQRPFCASSICRYWSGVMPYFLSTTFSVDALLPAPRWQILHLCAVRFFSSGLRHSMHTRAAINFCRRFRFCWMSKSASLRQSVPVPFSPRGREHRMHNPFSTRSRWPLDMPLILFFFWDRTDLTLRQGMQYGCFPSYVSAL